MTTLLLGFVLLGLVIAAMSIGVLLGRKPIAGSCGGIGAALGEKNYNCDICGGDLKQCEENQSAVAIKTRTSLAVDAMRASAKSE